MDAYSIVFLYINHGLRGLALFHKLSKRGCWLGIAALCYFVGHFAGSEKCFHRDRCSFYKMTLHDSFPIYFGMTKVLVHMIRVGDFQVSFQFRGPNTVCRQYFKTHHTGIVSSYFCTFSFVCRCRGSRVAKCAVVQMLS